jgi:hypothetical protein
VRHEPLTPWPDPAPGRLRLVLAAGIVLRIVVYVFQSPFSNDDHAGVIMALVATGRFPDIRAIPQAYHPPLYYVLAIPWTLWGGWKTVQAFSLLLSIATLYALYRLVRQGWLVPNPVLRAPCLVLAAGLLQLILFSNYISNDALAVLLGASIALQIRGYVAEPSRRGWVDLALLLGLGLLTKHTFVAYAPCLLALVLLIEWRRGARRALAAAAVFGLIAGAVGSYKFVESGIRYGRPFVTALEIAPPGILAQQRIAPGIGPFLDLDVLAVLRSPVSETLTGSPWLLLYASFWYPFDLVAYLRGPEGQRLLSRVIALLALGPTTAMVLGLAMAVRDAWTLAVTRALPPGDRQERLFRSACVMLLLANLALVVLAGARSGVWSVFQGRHLFPSMPGLLAALGLGLGPLAALGRGGRAVVWGWLGLLMASYLGYLALGGLAALR